MVVVAGLVVVAVIVFSSSQQSNWFDGFFDKTHDDFSTVLIDLLISIAINW